MFPSLKLFKNRLDKRMSDTTSMYLLLPQSREQPHEIPSFLTHLSCYYWNANHLSALLYLSFRITVSATSASEAFEFCNCKHRCFEPLLCLAENIPGTQKQHLLLRQVSHTSRQINDWMDIQKEKWVRKDQEVREVRKRAENKATAKKKLQPKEMILLSNEKLSYRWPR